MKLSKSLLIGLLGLCLLTAALILSGNRASAAGSPVVWFEIYVSKLPAAEEFYGKLLDWQFQPTPGYPEMNYIVSAPGSLAGALIAHDGRVNDSWGTILYFKVSKIHDSFDTATKLGAAVVVPIGVIKGVGSITLIRDLDNNIFGLISDEGA